MTHSPRIHAMIIASLAAAGCGGGSGSSSLPSAPPNKTFSNATHATFVVKIPAKASGPASKRRHYITSNVQGISFSVSDATNPALGGFTFYPLTPASPGCTGTVPSGVTCTLDVVAPPGTDTFVVDLYDSTEAGAAYVISTGTVTAAITAQASNTIGVITDGVPTWAAMGFASPYPTTSGAFPLTIDVADPSGDIIVGSYDAPVTLTDTDASGTTSLSKTSLAQPSDTTGIMLNWNGATISAAATITANSTDGIANLQTGTTTIGSAQIFPTGVGPAASQGTFYFANVSAASQPLSISGENGSSGPFTTAFPVTSVSVTSCAGFITISGFSPNFTIGPLVTTAPVSGGFPGYQTLGTCEFYVLDSNSNSTTYNVMIGQ